MVAPTALILEDSPTQAQIIGRMVEAHGWSVVHCASVREATESLQQLSFQALFLDVFVGVYNSLQHIHAFRALAPKTPIVIMTAGSSKQAVEETLTAARQARADYVLRKPFGDESLKAILAEAGKAAESPGRRRHVLVIDDSGTIRSVAGKIFEGAGYRVSKAGSMEEAFESNDIAHIDLALCDIFMPGMGGFQGMRTIKRVWPHVKIIAMSAGIDKTIDETQALNAARKIGADAQIKKPFSADELLELTDMVLTED